MVGSQHLTTPFMMPRLSSDELGWARIPRSSLTKRWQLHDTAQLCALLMRVQACLLSRLLLGDHLEIRDPSMDGS